MVDLVDGNIVSVLAASSSGQGLVPVPVALVVVGVVKLGVDLGVSVGVWFMVVEWLFWCVYGMA